MANLDGMIAAARRIRGTRIARGLSPGELESAESAFNIRFPDDLRAFLAQALPVGPDWPNWRSAVTSSSSADAAYVRERLAWPLHGLLFDVEHDSFWDPLWGERPDDLAAARAVATRALQAAPTLIPIYKHRYIPQEPALAGNPVFSVYQMDIIVYGKDLERYLHAEADHWQDEPTTVAREIRCWTRWMALQRDRWTGC